MCIARVSTHVSVCRLSGGQIGYSGHVVNFERDVREFATSIPHRPEEIDFIVVRRQGTNRAGEAVHRDFTIRPWVIRRWLEYLIANNPYYSDVTLDEERMRDLATGAARPDDAVSVLSRLRQIVTPRTPGDEGATADGPAGAARGSMTSSCSAASTGRGRSDGRTELEMIQEALAPGSTAAAQGPVPFGEVDRAAPISEGTAGVIACAFPSLFPDGQDLLSARPRRIDEHEYFKHIIRLGARFADHTRFTYVAMNTNLRHRFLGAGRVFLQRNGWAAGLSEEDLQHMADNGDTRLTDAVSRFVNRVPGSDAYWQRQRCLLETMADQRELGTPHLFLTLSAADTYW